MKIISAKEKGFCFGVKNAVDLAFKNAGKNVYTYGELIHNNIVIENLEKKGVTIINDLDSLSNGDVVIIRSHGIPKKENNILLNKNDIKVIDATCPFVKKIHNIVQEHHDKDYQIIIIGKSSHSEVIGINGWCDNSAIIIEDENQFNLIDFSKNMCVVAQTTFSVQKYKDIIKKIQQHALKTVEIFDTICYTTYRRQVEAMEISASCDVMLVIGSSFSSNTSKLLNICRLNCKECYLIQKLADLKKIKFESNGTVGIVAGASAPEELILEVEVYMEEQNKENLSQEFIDGVEESLVQYKEGKKVTGKVILADENGIHVNIGGKKDALIPKDEVCINIEDYNSEDYKPEDEIEAILIKKQDKDSGCVLLSKKKLDVIKEGDKVVEQIRDGSIFELKIQKDTKGGLLSKIGTYTVFVPASHIKLGFVKDLKQFVGKNLRLTVLEIDDAKHKIVASAKKVVEDEKKEREEIFWSHVQPDVIVSGKVKRITNFGAFVSVDGFDCLAHIVDISWNHIKSVDEVLKIGESYDFLVLSVDKEKGRVSLSYKLLQPHPFDQCVENHPIGSVTKGKVTSIVPFGAFVEIEKGIEGLVHVSEAAHQFVKNINEVVKVGDEVEVKVLNADPSTKKITLSIKACLPEEEGSSLEETAEVKVESKAKSSRKKDKSEGEKEWTEDVSNNPFAALLNELEIDEK